MGWIAKEKYIGVSSKSILTIAYDEDLKVVLNKVFAYINTVESRKNGKTNFKGTFINATTFNIIGTNVATKSHPRPRPFLYSIITINSMESPDYDIWLQEHHTRSEGEPTEQSSLHQEPLRT